MVGRMEPDGDKWKRKIQNIIPSASNSVVLSSDFSDREFTHLFQIFPVELWLPILNELLLDCDNLQNLSNASAYFRNLLLPRRVVFLFPKVWNILAVKYHEDIEINPRSVYQEPLQTGELSSVKTRWFSGILKLRLVCRTWCEGVDSWYQNWDFHWKMKNDSKNCYDSRLISLCQDFLFYIGRRKQAYFLNLFLSYSVTNLESENSLAIGNPFFGRAIKLKILLNLDSPSEFYFNRLCQVLSKYGHCLWYCTIDFNDRQHYRVPFYSILKSILELLPNLKVLDITYEQLLPYPEKLCTPAIVEDQLTRLQSEIGSSPLPTIGTLTFLKITMTKFPSCIFQEILRTNGHISMLLLDRNHIDYQDYDIYTVPLPNLRQLSLRINSREEFLQLAVPSVKWPITKLELEFYPFILVKWEEIFRLLEEKWSDTLTNLTIILPLARKLEDRLFGKCSSLNLPHLTNLKLEIRNFVSLDFLLPLQNNLRHLDLKIDHVISDDGDFEKMERLENGKIIQLTSVADRPLESNIWTVFPKLKRLHFKRSIVIRKTMDGCKDTEWTYSREEWYHKNKY